MVPPLMAPKKAWTLCWWFSYSQLFLKMKANLSITDSNVCHTWGSSEANLGPTWVVFQQHPACSCLGLSPKIRRIVKNLEHGTSTSRHGTGFQTLHLFKLTLLRCWPPVKLDGSLVIESAIAPAGKHPSFCKLNYVCICVYIYIHTCKYSNHK